MHVAGETTAYEGKSTPLRRGRAPAHVRVVVLGGSAVATPGLAEAIVRTPGRSQPMDLVLVGRDPDRLGKVAHVARLLAGDDALLAISHTTDVEIAFQDADYVINQIRVGGLQARAFDESFPHDLGLPGEETVGPGGFANASRTIPVVLEYARMMERICPKATLLTFANPSSLVQYAITRYTGVTAVGLCDGPVHFITAIAKAIGASPDELAVDYLGMHHFGWVTRVTKQGQDLLPQVLAKAPEVAPEVEPAIVRAIGAVPGPYLNYVFHPDRMLAKKRGRRTRAEELLDLQDEILADYERSMASGEKPESLARRKARWYDAIIAPVLLAFVEAHALRTTAGRFILNVVNGQTVPWLPAEAVVEVPTVLEGGRVRPLATGPVPADVKALVMLNCTYEMLAVEAIVERDRAKALRALLTNPIIHTYDQAAATLERAWGA
jgi:6-phospho-beta-glucosidase